MLPLQLRLHVFRDPGRRSNVTSHMLCLQFIRSSTAQVHEARVEMSFDLAALRMYLQVTRRFSFLVRTSLTCGVDIMGNGDKSRGIRDKAKPQTEHAVFRIFLSRLHRSADVRSEAVGSALA